MKKVVVISTLIIFVTMIKIFVNDEYNQKDFHNIMFAKEYNKYENFDIKVLPENVFYKLSINCKYYLCNQNDILQVIHNNEEGMIIYYNDEKLDLGDMESGFNYSAKDTNAYIIKCNNAFYIFLDHMHFADTKYYHLYKLSNKKFETVLEDFGCIDFVGHDYIIGYTDLGIIGYQKCEFKKVFKDGKFELDGEYKISDKDGEYPFWKFYTLVNDLKYDEFNIKTKEYNEKILKKGSKIRALATDAKSYIKIESEKGLKGLVRVDRVEGVNKEFIVNEKLFMKYYFIDGTKYDYEVIDSMFAY